jgi:hypothetical protein
VAPVSHAFKLSSRPGRGVSCDDSGLAVAGAPLLEKAGAGWRPRALGEVNAELSRAYGFPVDVAKRTALLGRVAEALNDGDLAMAQIAALHLRLPDPPEEDAPTDPTELVTRLATAGLIKILWEESKHPRQPAGSPDSTGGEFASSGGASGPTPNAVAASREAATAPTSESTASEDQRRRLTIQTTSIEHDGTVNAKFFIQPPSKAGGVVVQRIESTDVSGGRVRQHLVGWEAWAVSPGAVTTDSTGPDDEWSAPPQPPPRPSIPTKRTVVAEARFYEGISMADLVRDYGFTKNGSGFSGELQSTQTDPHLPTDHASQPARRTRDYVMW